MDYYTLIADMFKLLIFIRFYLLLEEIRCHGHDPPHASSLDQGLQVASRTFNENLQNKKMS